MSDPTNPTQPDPEGPPMTAPIPDPTPPTRSRRLVALGACCACFVALLVIGALAPDTTAEDAAPTTTTDPEPITLDVEAPVDGVGRDIGDRLAEATTTTTTTAPPTTTTTAPPTTTTTEAGPRLGDPNVANSDEGDGRCDQDRWLSDPDCGLSDAPVEGMTVTRDIAMFTIGQVLCEEANFCGNDAQVEQMVGLACDVFAELSSPNLSDEAAFDEMASMISFMVATGELSSAEGEDISYTLGAVWPMRAEVC